MATRSLGTLTLDLVAKTGGFVQGMDKAERASAKWRKQVKKDLDTIKTTAAVALGAASAATAALVVSQTKAAAELRQQAQLANSTTQEFQRLAVAADVVGLSQEKISDQLKDFNEKLGEFQQSGGGGMADFFEQIAPQVDITAEAFKNLSGPQALQLYYDSLEKAGLSQQQMSFYMESMASDSTALIPLLRNGGEALNFFGDEAERAGAIMDRDTIDAAERLGAAAWVAQQGLDGLKNNISAELLPTLADLAGVFLDVAEDGAAADAIADALGGTVKTLAATAAGAVAAVQLLGKTLGGIAAVADAGTGDLSIFEMLDPAARVRALVENWGEAQNALDVVGEDLDATALDFAEKIQAIWSAGETGADSDAQSLIDRVAEFRKALQAARDAAGEAPAQGGGDSAAAKALMAQLEEQRLLLEEGEEAAYRYSLSLKGIQGAEADAAVEAKRHNDELLAARDEREQFNDSMATWADGQRAALESAAQADRDYADSLKATLDPLGRFEQEAARVQEIFDKGLLGDASQSDIDAYITKLREAAGEAAGIREGFDFGTLQSGLGGAVDSLSQIQGAMADGSSEAAKLADVMGALAVVQGMAAVANAMASGDPYTAVPRALAVAAMLASAGIETGASGGASTAAADAQAAQGAGDVLGDTNAKSESIMAAVEMTADATSELPGLARAQLDALRAMQQGISGAANLILRGGNSLPGAGPSIALDDQLSGAVGGWLGDRMDTIRDPLKRFTGLELDFVGDWLDDILGGSSDVINEGIEIAGGRISELIDDTVVRAFQDVEEKKHILDDKDVKRYSEILGDGVGGQFELIFSGMVDSVTEAAKVLDVADEEIQNRIDRFRVAATEISLKDLDGEDQQAELEAVFSDIFDSLAGAVLPYAQDFQVGGEAIAETLVRIATQVQVADELMGQLGNTLLDGLAGEDMAQASDDLVKAFDGLENFMAQVGKFVDNFATDEHKFKIAAESINSVFSQIGREVPASRDAVWDLMQTLTDPADIERLSGLTDAMKEYYGEIERIENEQEGLTDRWLSARGESDALLARQQARELEAVDESNRSLLEHIHVIENHKRAAEEAAAEEQKLAQALQAITDFQRGVGNDLLSIISPAHAELETLNQAMAAQIATARELELSESDLANMRQLHQLQLLEFAAGLEESIISLSDQLFGTVDDSMAETVRSVDDGMAQVRDSMVSAIADINDWLDSSLLSDVSPLLPQERLDESRRQLQTQAAAARGGDVEALAGMRELADRFLSESSSFYGGSTQEFDADFMFAREIMQGLAGLDVPDAQPTYKQQEAIATATQETALSAFEQLSLSSDLVGQIAALARVTEESPSDIAERLGVPMGELIDTLGFVPDNMALALDDQFDSLVGGFDARLDPLLTTTQAQLEVTHEMAKLLASVEGRLARIEDDTARGVGLQAVTAGNTGAQASSARELVASQRLDASSPRQAARLNP